MFVCVRFPSFGSCEFGVAGSLADCSDRNCGLLSSAYLVCDRYPINRLDASSCL